VIPASFDYTRPKTVAEAVTLLGENPEAKILAGGHSLIPLMRFRLAEPSMLIDINQLEELRYIREGDSWLEIGAMTREAAVESSEVVVTRYPLLVDTARVVADPLVRNMATLGGNVAHADPANDHPATMLAYGAEMVITGASGERSVAAADFFVDAFTTALEPSEILTAIRIPRAKDGDGGAYFKLERKVGDFATAAVAAQVCLSSDGVTQSAGIGLTNVGLTPIYATAASESLIGSALTDEKIQGAAKLASEAAEPIADHRGSEDYKRHLVATFTTRALKTARERAQGGAA